MSKIQITPAWKDVKPSGYYVYIHRRATDGSVFYVGKGSLRRAWDKSPRSEWWLSVARKNGVLVDIFKDEMPEHCAHALEKILIFNYRRSGANLCNMSDGGEGSSGAESPLKKMVYCSNGMKFEGTVDAASWVSNTTGAYACFSAISAAAIGTHYSAYGYSWSYDGPPEPYISPSDRRRVAFSMKTYCSNGMEFDSLTMANEWVKENINPRASSGKISRAARSPNRTAYGFRWSYTPFQCLMQNNV